MQSKGFIVMYDICFVMNGILVFLLHISSIMIIFSYEGFIFISRIQSYHWVLLLSSDALPPPLGGLTITKKEKENGG